MRRVDLKVGTDYLVADTTNWRKYQFVGHRMRLIDGNLYARRVGTWEPSPVGEYVKMLDVDSGDTRHVRPRDIRADWDHAMAERARVVAYREADEAKREARRRSADELAERAAKVGLTVSLRFGWAQAGGDEYVITPDALAAFLNRTES